MEKLLACALASSLVFLAVSGVVVAQEPILPCYHYGSTDGHLGKPTAFASWWNPPSSVPLTVRPDFMGVALAGLAPGALVEIEIVGLPSWAWKELREELIGRTVVAVVADRPGSPTYADAWFMTFWALSDERMWIGLLYIEITELQ